MTAKLIGTWFATWVAVSFVLAMIGLYVWPELDTWAGRYVLLAGIPTLAAVGVAYREGNKPPAYAEREHERQARLARRRMW